MNFGVLIIGDEILHGKRRDQHFEKAIELLARRGLDLSWCRFLGDDPELITRTLKETFSGKDCVFSFGGIGATPDDHTRQCAADALGVPLTRHPDALKEIVAKWGDAAFPKRALMADFPDGADAIPNPFNRIAGFSVRQHYFLPGFPEMAWPMMEWVLDTRYSHLFHTRDLAEKSITVLGAAESLLIDLMNEVARGYPQVKVFSLPSLGPERPIELGVRGDAREVEKALAHLEGGVQRLGFRFTQ